MQPTPPIKRLRAERGAVLLTAVLVILMLAGLSVALLEESMAESRNVQQRRASVTALEICEMGISKASLEVIAMKDAGSDGIGFVSGDYANGSFAVTATQDAVNPDRWVLTAEGTYDTATRHIEVGVRRRENSYFVEGLFAKDTLKFNGNTGTDAYDSRLGTYASQANSSDSGGTYATGGGHIGSNLGIELNGSAVSIRGNAIPGPLHTVTISGSPTVWGDTLPRRIPIDLPPASQAEFEAAFTTNNNAELLPSTPGKSGKVKVKGGGGAPVDTGTYDPKDHSLTSKSHANVTLSGGTYFFSSIKLGAHSTLTVKSPTVIYVTTEIDISSGSLANVSGKPVDLIIYAHPYAVGGLPAPSSTAIKLRGSSGIAMALYGPGADLDAGGGDDIFGSFIANTITIHGDTRFHYDKALGELLSNTTVTLERLYWRDLDERVR